MAEGPQRPEDKDRRGETAGARQALEVLALAFLFPVATYLGFVAGSWVGERLGSAVWGGVLGGVLGAAAGFLELIRQLRREAP